MSLLIFWMSDHAQNNWRRGFRKKNTSLGIFSVFEELRLHLFCMVIQPEHYCALYINSISRRKRDGKLLVVNHMDQVSSCKLGIRMNSLDSMASFSITLWSYEFATVLAGKNLLVLHCFKMTSQLYYPLFINYIVRNIYHMIRRSVRHFTLFSQLRAVLHKTVARKMVNSLPSIKISYDWMKQRTAFVFFQHTNQPFLRVFFFRLFKTIEYKHYK